MDRYSARLIREPRSGQWGREQIPAEDAKLVFIVRLSSSSSPSDPVPILPSLALVPRLLSLTPHAPTAQAAHAPNGLVRIAQRQASGMSSAPSAAAITTAYTWNAG